MTLTEAMQVGRDRDERDTAIYAVLGLTAPGGYALREADGRLMVWACRRDAEDDDGARATYRSRGPISDREWAVITGDLAWIEDYEVA